jgi:hypothetical protein
MTAPERIDAQARLIRWVSVTAIAAVIAMVLSIVGFSERLDGIQTERQGAATASCYLDRSLVVAAEQPGQEAATQAFLSRTVLGDCNTYGRAVRNGHALSLFGKAKAAK